MFIKEIVIDKGMFKRLNGTNYNPHVSHFIKVPYSKEDEMNYEEESVILVTCKNTEQCVKAYVVMNVYFDSRKYVVLVKNKTSTLDIVKELKKLELCKLN